MSKNKDLIVGGDEDAQQGHQLVDAVEDDGRVRHHIMSETIAVGQWYWVTSVERVWDEEAQDHVEKTIEWLGCVMHVGSNFLKLQQPSGSGSYRTARVHFDEFWESLRLETNAEAVIDARVAHYQGVAAGHLKEIQAITARLGVSSQTMISGGNSNGDDTGRSLMTLSAQTDVKQYENALVLARDKLLPDLFKAVKEANANVVTWMTARSLPMQAMADGMQGVVGEIEDRIFNVSLYAGLTEEVVKCCEGEPAQFHEKLHVMQRMLFMDEECLLNYSVGGMEFKHIEEFDEWVSVPENRDRMLPFHRCLVAMRVRRDVKKRTWDGSFRGALIKFQLEQENKLTFLYLRNGSIIYRLSCELDFDETIFPDRSEFDPGEPMMVKMFGSRIEKMIRLDDYEDQLAKYKEVKRLEKKWYEDNPEETWDEKLHGSRWMSNPHRHHGFEPRDWQPFDPSSVYFDDVGDTIRQRMKKYNRVATIVQGLYDRSDVFHPHPPAKTWTPEGFNAAMTLVYDGSEVLYDGAEPPDFEAYREACNESMGLGSIVIGQELVWEQREAEKENKRIQDDWRYRGEKRYHERYRPYGNEGPGFMSEIAQWKPRSKEATFTWNRERQRDGNYYSGKSRGDAIRANITVAQGKLFNVSAYKPGDYKQFFRDPRTRAEYLKWAHILLTAEEFHAGNAKAQRAVRD